MKNFSNKNSILRLRFQRKLLNFQIISERLGGKCECIVIETYSLRNKKDIKIPFHQKLLGIKVENLIYKNKSLVISSKERHQCIIHDIYVGISNDSKEQIKASYRGKDIQLNKKLGKNFSNIKLKVTLNDLSRSTINTRNRGKL